MEGERRRGRERASGGERKIKRGERRNKRDGGKEQDRARAITRENERTREIGPLKMNVREPARARTRNKERE